jgi:hypothetical protein
MVLPALSSRYTGDPLDAALYFIGGGLFYTFNLLPARPYQKRVKLIS